MADFTKTNDYSYGWISDRKVSFKFVKLKRHTTLLNNAETSKCGILKMMKCNFAIKLEISCVKYMSWKLA